MGIDITRLSLGGISAVGRSKVGKKITTQEHNEVLMVLFHLEQFVSLHDELNELVPTEIDRKNLEVAARVMVKIMKTEKKTFPLMLDKQRPVRKDVNYKSDSTPIGTPDFKPDGTVMTTTSSKSKGTLMSTSSSKDDGTLLSTPSSKSDGTPMCTPMTTAFFESKGTPRGTPSSKSDGTPMCTPMTIAFSESKGTPMGPPNSKMGNGHQVQSSINSEFHTKSRVAHTDESAIHCDWHTKTEMVHQDELKMIKYQVSSEDMYPDKCGSMENVQGQVKKNRDVFSKSKFPMSLTNDENEEDVKNDEEVKDDDDDVCDSMTKVVGSSYNSPDVKKQDGEVDEEPGGNVSARSRSLRFRQSKA